MDKIINIFDPNNHEIYFIMKDVLLLLIMLYSIFLNSFMINKNVSKFKSNAIFTCIAVVSVWQIYDFNPSTYCMSNAVWFGSILVICASGEKLKKRWKFFIYGATLIAIPVVFLAIYLNIISGDGLAILNISVFLLTILACLCVPLATNNQYIKISTLIVAITIVAINVLPEFTGNMDVVWGFSILNLIAYLVFMNSIQKFVGGYM